MLYNMVMNLVAEIRKKFAGDIFEFSKHAVDQTILRGITVDEIRQAVRVCEVIEDYPSDKYGPSCLLLGFTRTGRPLHIHCSYPSRPVVKIITIYEPNLSDWNDFRVRR